MLHDEDLAQVIIDRVLERGRLDGPSVRMMHVNLDDALNEESDQLADWSEMSGKSRSESPEPTSTTSRCGVRQLTFRLKRSLICDEGERGSHGSSNQR